jgi:hypothetical protein
MADTLDEGIDILLEEELAQTQTTIGVNLESSTLSQLEKIERDAAELQGSLGRLMESLENLREALGGGTP